MKWIVTAVLMMAFIWFICLRVMAEGQQAWAHLEEDDDE